MTKWRRLAWEPAIISHDWHGWRGKGLYCSHLAGGPRECRRCRGPSRSMCSGCPDMRCPPPRRDTGPVSTLSQREWDRGRWPCCCSCHGTKPSSHGCLSAHCKMVWSPFLCWITEMSWCLFVHLNTLHGNQRKNCQCEKLLLGSLLSKCLFFWCLYPLLPVVSPQLTVGISWATVNSPTGREGTKPGPVCACAGSNNASTRARWGSGHHLELGWHTPSCLMAIWRN